MANTPVLKSSEIISNVPLYDNVTSIRELMGAKEIPVSFTATNPVYVPVGAYIMFRGEQYTINTVPSVTKTGEHEYQYKVVFESVLYRLYDKKLRHLGNRTFQYFGTPAEYANLIVANINEIDSGWTVGPCDDLDPKPISFSGHTCRTALDVVAEAFQIEWDETSKVIRFTKQVGATTSHVFKYGQGKGLYSLSYSYQNDKNIVTRAYGYGSTKNLPKGYRSGATQLMFSEGYLENNVALYGVKEGDYENEDIYPKVAGTISDALDFDLEAGSFKVVDDSLSFNLNDYKSVEVPKLSFTNGELQGQNFDIIDYNNTTKTYTLKVFVDGNNMRLPNATFKAKPGDTYTLFDMPLPSELLLAAEAELKAKTLEWLQTNSKPQVLYSLELDPLYARANNIILKPGDRVTIIDEALGINELIRVSKVEYPVNFPEEITPSTKINIEIANFVPYTLTERVLSDIKENKQQVKTTISQSNYIKRMAEYVKTLSGVDYLPPNTFILDPATGSISASLINADYIIARNLIAGPVKITAADGNIVFEDSDKNAIMMIDDDGAIDGITSRNTPPLTSPDGVVDPDFLYSRSVSLPGGGSELRYFFTLRGPGIRTGLSPKNSDGYSDMGRKGFYTNGKFEASYDGIGITMDKDGFNAKGKRTVSGHIILENLVSKYRVIQVQNGLIVGKNDNLAIADYLPLTEDQSTPLPVNNSNDTGYKTSDAGGGGGPVDPPVDPPAESMLIKDYYPYPIGYAMNHQITRADYLNVLKSGSVINPETALAIRHTQPGPTSWDWADADLCVNFAQANGIQHIHGSHLLWANDNNLGLGGPSPYFIFDFENQSNGKQLMIDFIVNHITTKVTRYRGIVKTWNAMNEFIKDDGTILDCVYTRLIPDFNELVEIIYTAAVTAAPENVNLYNDYNLETGNLNRTNTLIAAMNALLAKNIFVGNRQVKIDGVGFQFHTFRMPELDMARVETRFDRWFQRGLKVAITELDMSPTPTTSTPEWNIELADRYERIITMLERSAKTYGGGLSAILLVNFWSATDRGGFWNQGKGAPGSSNPITNHSALHDYYSVRKLAYQRLIDFGKNRQLI